jgi:hypothetical protein
LRRLCNFLGWVVVVTALIAFCGVMTAPLLLVLTADVALGVLFLQAAEMPSTTAAGRA